MIRNNIKEIILDVLPYEMFDITKSDSIEVPSDSQSKQDYRVILALAHYLSGCVGNTSVITMREIEYQLSNCLRIQLMALRIVATLKNSPKIKPYVIFSQKGLKCDRAWGCRIEVDLHAGYDDVIKTKHSKFGIRNIIKQHYDMEPKMICLKTKLMSDSLRDTIDDVIDRLANGESDALKYQDKRLQIQNLAAISRYRSRIAYDEKNIRNFTINKKGEFTYMPAHKKTVVIHNDENGTAWKKDGRQSMKYGKAISKIFKHPGTPYISDATIQEIASTIKSRYTFTADLKIVKGEDIRYYYNGDTYANVNTESLGASCMRHESCQEYMDIYVDNPDIVEMLIAKSQEGLIGRAIIWTTDQGDVVMDRIYGNEMTINAFKDYAKNNGILHKYRQSYTDSGTWVTSIGEMIEKDFTITLVNNSEYKPYMDTFKWTDDHQSEKIVINNAEEGDYTLESTEGGPDERTRLHNGDLVHPDDAVWLQYEDYEDYYHNDDVIYCQWSDESYHESDAVQTVDGECVYMRHDDLVEINDDYYHIDNTVYSEFMEETIRQEDAVLCEIHGDIHSDASKHIVIALSEITGYVDQFLGERITCLPEMLNDISDEDGWTVHDSVSKVKLIEHLIKKFSHEAI
jgi:hypothetical protein